MSRLLFVFLCLCGLVWGQSDRSTITGLVLDPASAAVPGARVEAVNQGTQLKYTSNTNESGLYSLQQLPVGRYELSVEAAGFNRFIAKDIDVPVAQTLTVNVNLVVGAVSSTVEVTGGATLVATSSSENGTNVNRRMVIDLPLSVSGNMRNPESFIFLTPGVTGTAGNTQINGSQSRAKEVLFDGVGATSPESGGTLFSYPSVEAISEFRLVASNFSAEYGRTGGGFEVFNTKSGTNDWHGSVFDYLRNNVFDARGFYARTAPVNRQNEFGAALGGPVHIPRVYNGTNRTFFYFVYSGFRYVQNASTSLISVPPPAFRTGDFSSLTDRNGRQMVIYDPATTRPNGSGGFIRDAFPGNKIPTDRISAVSAKIAALLPSTAGANLNNFLSVGNNSFNRDQVNVKIDHSLSDRNRLSGYVYINSQAQIDPGILPDPFTNALNNMYHSRWARASDDWVLSPTLLNHLTLGFTREAQLWNSMAANQDWPTKVGLKGVNTGPGNAFPYVTFNDGYNTWGSTNGTKTVGQQVNNVWQLDDSVAWIRGSHSLKFGAEGRWLQTNGADFFGTQGNFAFNTLETGLPGNTSTGSAFASFLLGAVHQGQYRQLAVVPGNRYRYFAAFAQDDWKVSRKLTLNLGLRYDIYFPRTEAHNALSSFDPTLPNPGAGNRPGAIAFLGGGQTSFADTDYKSFGPRIGFAFAASPRTSIRGGYGIYYAPGNATSGLRQSQTYSFGFNATPTFASTDNGVTPAFNWDNGFPQNFVRPPVISPTVANGSAVAMIGRGDGRPPYFQNWSIGIQREIVTNLMMEATYVGVKGTRMGTALIRPNELDPRFLSYGSLLTNPVTSAAAQAQGIPIPYAGFTGSVAQALRPFPQYLDITNNSNPNGNSTYNALQAKVEKRLSFGLTGVFAYSWSKSIADGNIQAGGGLAGQTFYNRRLEKAVVDTDVPQAIALSYTYELPFGPGKHYLNRGGVAGKLAGGWTITGIHQYYAGVPIVLTANNGLPLFNGTLRPNAIAGVQRHLEYSQFDPAVNRWINPAAFAAPPAFTFGTSARSYTDLRAPWSLNESYAAIKRTPLTERITLTFRAEFFNVFNRVVFGLPAANVSNANFGLISSQGNTPRQGQMALRLEF